MRIAFIAPHYAPEVGGVARHVGELARAFAEDGHEVEVITQCLARSLPREQVIEGVLVRRFASISHSSTYPFAPALFACVARLRGRTIVHAHGYHALPALASALARGAPAVLTPHYHGDGHTPLARALHRVYRAPGRRMVERADRVICVSHPELALVERDFPGVTGRTRVIPNGVDRRALEAADPFAGTGRLILSAGRLEAYKRVDRVIEAMPLLDPAHRLVVLGDGPQLEPLRAQARSLGVADRVDLRGFVPDHELHRWLRTASVVVSLSSAEAYGLSVAEGLAAGAGVVASSIPAHVDSFGSFAGVTLVPADAAPAAVAAAIAAARPGASRVPSWDEVAAETLALYEELA